MKFTCDRCNAQYMISDEKVGPSGVKVRCKKCGNVIVVRRAADVPAEPAPAPAAAPAPAPQEGAGNGAGTGNGAGAGAGDGAQAGLDAELGNAFDHAFGESPAAPAAEGAAPAADSGAEPGPAEEASAPAAAAPPATEWYVAIGQAQVGPLPLTEVKRKWEAGDVGPDSLVWRPGMGDWQALSTQTDLAEYLAPVPRGSAQPSRAEAPLHKFTPQPMPAAAPPAEPAAEVSWKPVGASALAALASEEIAARGAPEARPAAEPKAPAAGVKSLVEGLPDGGGVDPTGAIPLSIKGLEVTGEKKLERRSTIASRAEETRHKRSMTRVIVAAAAVVLLAVGGAVAWVMTQSKPAPRVASVPLPPPPAIPAPAAAPPPPPAPAAAPAAPAPAAPVAAAAPAAPAPAAPHAAAPATPPRAAPPEPEPAAPAHKLTKKERLAAAKAARAAKAAGRVAAAPAPASEEAPPPKPAGKRKDALLDFDSNDSALDEALGGGGSKRSVYVPPAPTGGGSLPDKLTAAQINESVASRIDALRRCVSEQKARDPSASGVLKLKWTIAGDGGVRDVKPLPGEYSTGPFSGCITGVVKGIKFPRSATKGQEVTFPFSF
jgi:predicted Zn finger-like uncharacterized protein